MNKVIRFCILSGLLLLTCSDEIEAQSGVEESKGFISIYKKDQAYYFDIPDSIIGRDILVITRIINASSDLPRYDLSRSSYSGSKTIENIIRFELRNKDSIELTVINYPSNRQSLEFKSVSNADDDRDINTAKIDHINNNAYHFNANKLLKGINSILYLNSTKKRNLKLGAYDSAHSSINSIRSNSLTIELITKKIFENQKELQLSTCLLLLSKAPMRPRFSDKHVNYFVQPISGIFNEVKKDSSAEVIFRWKLEPRPEDMASYKLGNLVEPRNPIVFYIDSSVPAKWVPFFAQAVNDWQKVFEHAGFKNAIIAKKIPTKSEDPSFSLYDVRHSVIHYLHSPIPDATYSTVVDPRSGEIIQSHILWSTGCEKLQRNLYLIQASPSDKKGRRLQFEDNLMGRLIQAVVSHEIGHALGFDHNMIASNAVPVEHLRNGKWLDQHSYTNSIMDYARYNYVAQPGDKITSLKGLIYGIGDYDKWAIKYGYTYLNYISVKAEIDTLHKWIAARMGIKKYKFSLELPSDPRTIAESLGDDLVKASYYGIENLKFVITHLFEWIDNLKDSSTNVKEIYNAAISQFNLYVGHVAANIGGIYEPIDPMKKPVPIPLNMQKRALGFLDKTVLKQPEWLFNDKILTIIGEKKEMLQKKILSFFVEIILLNDRKINNLVKADQIKTTTTLTFSEFITTLNRYIFDDVERNELIDPYKRILQGYYISRLIYLRDSKHVGDAEQQIIRKSVIDNALKGIKALIQQKLPSLNDPDKKAYLQELHHTINR